MHSGWRATAREWWLPVLVAMVQGSRLLTLFRLADRDLVRFLPDDAFYYLVLGKNFAATGRWSFDGVEPTTGFHLLWGYMVAALFKVAPAISLHQVVIVTGCFELFCVVVAVSLSVRTVQRLFGPGSEAGVAVIFLSADALLAGSNLMETSLVVVFASALIALLARPQAAWAERTSVPASWPIALGALLGFAGMAARSDFALLPFGLFVMQWMLWRRRRSGSDLVKVSGAALAGSVAGAILLALHTHTISGGWVQASAQQKLHWSRVNGFSLWQSIAMVRAMFELPYGLAGWTVRHPGLWGLAVLWRSLWFGFLATGLVRATRQQPGGRSHSAMLIALGSVVVAYLVFYRFNSSALQVWYVGQFEAPLAVLVAASLSGFAGRSRWLGWTLAASICLSGVAARKMAPYPWQAQLWDAGAYLREHAERRPVGAWNAGIIAYAAGGGVTNLDGLVNDRILPYAKCGTLLQYIEERRIASIADYRMMFLPMFEARGGYGTALEACLEPLDFEPSQPGSDALTHVWLYRLKPQCRLPAAPSAR